jgi:hypothetical protein
MEKNNSPTTDNMFILYIFFLGYLFLLSIEWFWSDMRLKTEKATYPTSFMGNEICTGETA